MDYKLQPLLEVALTTLATFLVDRAFLVCYWWKKNTCDLELWTITLAFERDLDRVKLNHYFKYLGQRLFCSKVIVHTHTHTHTHTADRVLYTATKAVGNKATSMW